jgi:K+-transporting ATPase KdpF subunit
MVLLAALVTLLLFIYLLAALLRPSGSKGRHSPCGHSRFSSSAR